MTSNVKEKEITITTKMLVRSGLTQETTDLQPGSGRGTVLRRYYFHFLIFKKYSYINDIKCVKINK